MRRLLDIAVPDLSYENSKVISVSRNTFMHGNIELLYLISIYQAYLFEFLLIYVSV